MDDEATHDAATEDAPVADPEGEHSLRREALRAAAAVVVAAVSFLVCDPAAPESLLVPYRKDPSRFDTREGRRDIERSYRFLASYPWDVYSDEQRAEIRRFFTEMKARYGDDW